MPYLVRHDDLQNFKKVHAKFKETFCKDSERTMDSILADLILMAKKIEILQATIMEKMDRIYMLEFENKELRELLRNEKR